MNIITIDFETFYSREFSLTKMTTQEYILSPHFEVIGVSVKLNNDSTGWKSGTHAEIKEYLDQLPWDDAIVCAHNAMFDGAILEWIFDIHPKLYHCTMMSSRPICVPFTTRGKSNLAEVSKYYNLPPKGTEIQNALGMRRRDFNAHALEKYAAYCMHDTELCYFIAKKHLPQLPKEELLLISATITKFTRPKLELDLEVLTTRLGEVLSEKAQVLERCGLHNRDMLMSNDQFAAALIMFGVTPPMKISPRTGKETYAFAKVDVAFKELLEHPDVRVQLIVAARLKVKSTIEETRLQRFIDVYHAMQATDSKFAAPLLYAAAHTHRFGGWDKLNLQNLGRGSALRKGIKAPEGHKIVAGDLSQIEARITAVLAGEDSLVEAFARGEDVYSSFASRLYDFEVSKANTKERFVGKTCILGLGFGVGGATLKNSLSIAGVDVTLNESYRYVNTYRNVYPNIPELWSLMDKKVIPAMAAGVRLEIGFGIHTEKEAIVLPNGMKLRYPNLYQKRIEGYTNWVYDYRGNETTIYGAKLVENVVQALARIIVSAAEVYLIKAGHYAVLQVHDELLYVVSDEKVDKFSLVLRKVLERPVPWMPELPVAAEVEHGDTYADAK